MVKKMKSEQVLILHIGSTHVSLFKEIVAQLKSGWHYKIVQNQEDLCQDIGIFEQTILVVDEDQYEIVKESHVLEKLNRHQCAILNIIPAGESPDAEFDEFEEYLPMPLTTWRTARTLHQLFSALRSRKQMQNLENKLTSRGQELSELNKIGVALSAERDPDTLLDMILSKAREITSADAGSLYLVEKIPDIPEQENNYWIDKQLRFKLAQNDSLIANYKEFVLPVEKKSMAGYAAITGEPLNITDAYDLDPSSPVQHNRSFDDKMGYKTISILCLPMTNHRNEVIGVLQLINRKREWNSKLVFDDKLERQILAFDNRCVELASSLASQAAVSIENMHLYEEIKQLFEGFIVASVHAIEQRDPTTSGHSERVATLTVNLAKTIDKTNVGSYKDLHFTREDIQQINYASLLHDFGKIGVRENVLVKAKKLYPDQLEAIKFRFKYVKKAREMQITQKKINDMLNAPRDKAIANMEHLEQAFQQWSEQLDYYLDFILTANEPRVLEEGSYEKLQEIGKLVFRESGKTQPFITKDEISLLSIARGSLSEIERKEIESHVTHTFNFLSKIPWASHLKNIPQIAYAHHEKLDGKGYPRGLNSENIPIPSKMMAISDIFDALTASDRPYKRAVPTEKALDILGYEVKDGKLDSEMYNIFLEAKIYELVKKPE